MGCRTAPPDEPVIGAGIAAILSAIGVAQAIAGWVVVRRFAGRCGRAAANATRPVSVLKPLHGDEPLLEEALTSVCRQAYPALQVVFGVQDAADTTLPLVRRLQARFPDCDIAVVVDPRDHGPNRKVANLINMLPAAKHDVLVIADADMHVAPDWLHRLVAALEEPGVGLVTTVYTGVPVGPLLPRGEGEGCNRCARCHADQPLLPTWRAAGTGHGTAGLPRGHDDAAAGDAGANRRVRRPG
jgi:ceramide glucosyltransferase